MINFIVEFLIVALSSYLFVRKYFNSDLFSELILNWFILFFAQIVLIEIVLGSFGILYFENILLTSILVLGISFFTRRGAKLDYIIKPDVGAFFKSNLVLFAFSIFASFFLVKLYINLINPPWCPDSLQMHLAFPAAWIRSGNLDNPFTVFGSTPILNPHSLETTAVSYYPINAQLFFAWLMLPLRNAFLADVGEAPFYIIGIITVYSILRKYSVSETIALLGSFLWVLIPNIFKQLKAGSQIDVICAVVFLLMFYALLLFRDKMNGRYAVLFGISAGLFLGTKLINLTWFIALLPFAAFILCREFKIRHIPFLRALNLIVIIFCMAVLFGGYMYIKNYILVRNPFFPVDLKIAGKTIFKGILDNVSYKMQIAHKDTFDIGRIVFHEGLGVQFLTLVLPCLFIPMFSLSYLRKKVANLNEHVLLFITPILMFVIYGLFINIFVVRYLFPFVSLGLITAIIFINYLPKGKGYIFFISLISILASAFELAHSSELVVSLLFSILIFMILLFYKEKILNFYNSRRFNSLFLITLIILIFTLFYLNKKYVKEEFIRYPSVFSKKESWQADIGRAWQKLDELTKKGARVAYTGRQEFYPLFGSKLKNDVEYVSINKKEISPYNNPDGLCRRVKDFPAWKANLEKEKIQFFFIALPFFDNREYDDPMRFPIEDEWASTHPDDFVLLYSNSLAHIYRVNH
jgi:hypothetical protein